MADEKKSMKGMKFTVKPGTQVIATGGEAYKAGTIVEVGKEITEEDYYAAQAHLEPFEEPKMGKSSKEK